MTRNYYFADIKKYLDNKSAVVPILEACSSFADVAIIFTPIVFGPQFLPLLECLDAKDRLVEAGKKLLTFIEKQAAPNYKEKIQQIDAAYTTLSITAFVEALRENLPSTDVKDIILYFKENKCFDNTNSEVNISERSKSISIMFPNEVDSLSEVKGSLCELYERMCKELRNHFEKSIEMLEKRTTETDREKKLIGRIKNIISKLSKVPERALTLYTAQLVELMSLFPEFSAYIHLVEFAAIKESVKISEKQSKSFDIGLENLADQIKSITKSQKKEEAEIIYYDLRKFYKNEILKPIASNDDIIGDNSSEVGTAANDNIELEFPSIRDAYISQAYRCLRYDGTIGLENPKTWKKLPQKENIGDFFINYLGLPQSVEYPLIVLGLPGSGKSILTRMLAAQLMESTYTVIRIPLRDIDANNDIHVAVSEQIARVIQRPLKDGYAGFAEHYSNDPLFIIFDGYDELLQVKGEVFNGYITKVHEFQKEQYGLGRPVRVMITSRVTLIDKVKIPKNSVIVNLDAFDQERRNAWISIWNDQNKEFFSHNNVKPFHLKDNKDLSDNVRELAEQPLLLLMLAIFDSYGNALEGIGDNMSRTHLYDELIRKMCRREANKLYKMRQGDKEGYIDHYIHCEMSRLGVVAIGMFNRNLLHIKTKDLLSDLLTYKILNEKGEIPKEADNLIRSFFFVHKSITEKENEANKDYAYEFMHNTFGEFLAADFILNFLVREAGELFVAQASRMQISIAQKKLYDPNGLGEEWFTNLMFNPLYSRPLVLEMIREHLPCVLKRYNFTPKDFQSSFLELVKAQLKMFLEEKNLPTVMRRLDGFRDIKLPLLGHISTYTLNISILAALLSDDGFIFDERNYRNDSSQESETSPWNKLTNLWRTWFSTDNLTGLARIIRSAKTSANEGELKCIKLTCPTRIDDAETGLNDIEKQLCVANALSDQITIALCGSQTGRFSDIIKKDPEEIMILLESVSADLYLRYIDSQIRWGLSKTPSKRIEGINRLFRMALRIDLNNDVSREVFIEHLITIEISLDYHSVYLENQVYIFEALERYIRHRDLDDGGLMIYNRIVDRFSRNIDVFNDNERMFHSKKLNNILSRNAENLSGLNYWRDIEYLGIGAAHRLSRSIDNDKQFFDFNEHNMYLYMSTDPELVSRTLLLASQKLRSEKNGYDLIIDKYLDYIYKHTQEISLDKNSWHRYTNNGEHGEETPFTLEGDTRYGRKIPIGFRSIVYSIQIAANVNNYRYQQFALEIIQSLFRHNLWSEYFSAIILSSPTFIEILCESMPAVIERQLYEFLDRSMDLMQSQKSLRYDTISYAMSLIKIIRNDIVTSKSLRSNVQQMMHKFITMALREVKDFEREIYDVLTVSEYDNLVWYSKEFGVNLVELEIKKNKR